MSRILESAISKHRLRDWESAEQLYLLEIERSGSFQAMQLLGSMYSNLNRFEQAEYFLSKSLQQEPQQPDALFNLGLCYKKQNKFDKAIICFRKSISYKPNSESIYISLSDCLIKTNKLTLAESVINEGLNYFPNSHKLLFWKAKLLKIEKKYDSALLFYEKSLSYSPNYPPALNDLANLYRETNRSYKSIPIFKLAIEALPTSYELHHNLGNVYADLSNLSEAIEHFQRSIELEKQHAPSHKKLNHLLWSKGESNTFLKSYEQVDLFATNNEEMLFDYCEFLIQTGKWEQLNQYISQANPTKQYLSRYFTCLAKIAKYKNLSTEYIKNLEKAYTTSTEYNPEINFKYASALIEADNLSLAQQIISRSLELSPLDIFAIALQNDLKQLDHSLHQNTNNETRSLIQINSLDKYNSRDKVAILLNETLKFHQGDKAPIDQTLENGTQTLGNLSYYKNQEIQDFFKYIDPFLKNYINTHRNNVVSLKYKKSSNYQISGAWSVNLRKSGFHHTHIHPEGDLSAVFYLDLPSTIENEDLKEGWLQFGLPSYNHKNFKTKKLVKPEIGTLVIFPSYFWHGTIPFESNETRTTIAFDIKVEN